MFAEQGLPYLYFSVVIGGTRHVVRRACRLAEKADRGSILLTAGALDTLSREDWQAWLRIFSDARQGKL